MKKKGSLTQREKNRLVKSEEKQRKAVKFFDTKQKNRWVGWSDYEKPSKVTTYKLSDLENREKQSKDTI